MNPLPPTSPPEISHRILVVGVPRSGTTLVQSLLAAHTAVASWTESHLFARHYRPLPGLESRAVLIRDPTSAIREFLQENGLPEPEVLALTRLAMGSRGRWPTPLRTTAVARGILRMFDSMATIQGCTGWVEKTPAHLRFVPFLERVVESSPGLQFVHVVREGLATVASLHRASQHWERPYDLDECVARWNAEMRFSLSRSQNRSDHFVFYEDLIAAPEPETQRLLERLALPWEGTLLTRRASVAGQLTAPEEQAWKGGVDRAIEAQPRTASPLSTDERQRVEMRLQPELYNRLRELQSRWPAMGEPAVEEPV